MPTSNPDIRRPTCKPRPKLNPKRPECDGNHLAEFNTSSQYLDIPTADSRLAEDTWPGAASDFVEAEAEESGGLRGISSYTFVEIYQKMVRMGAVNSKLGHGGRERRA